MSMHLVSPALNDFSTKKRKNKPITITSKVARDFKEHNKQMKRVGLKEKSVEEYLAYRQGKSPVKNQKIIKDPFKTTGYIRPSPVVASYGDAVGNIPAKPEMSYSGERKLIGVATMHKSNSVPVFEQSDAEDIARMRR